MERVGVGPTPGPLFGGSKTAKNLNVFTKNGAHLAFSFHKLLFAILWGTTALKLTG